MNHTDNLLPLEYYLKLHANKKHEFPTNTANYFDRYIQIKSYLGTNVYPHIGAGTSAEDGGVYTDHSIEHFNAVIKYLGKLLNIKEKELDEKTQIILTPYETFVALVSILLHDAGNIFGRVNHEKKPFKIFQSMGDAICPDNFEALLIAKIAEVHGGKIENQLGEKTNDTITSLKEDDNYAGQQIRPRLIAALVRFADEICEDRTRAVTYVQKFGTLPKFSEIYHKYAASISSVDVDIPSKRISLKIEVLINDIMRTFGKGTSENIEDIYLIDEINLRLEKMFKELSYCKNFMFEACQVNKIRAEIIIYNNEMQKIENKIFELDHTGYPSDTYTLSKHYPDWCGQLLVDKYKEQAS